MENDTVWPALYGRGLKYGTAGQPITFTADVSKCIVGELSCKCQSQNGTPPSDIFVRNNKNSTYTFDLNTTKPGIHYVNVEWNGKKLPKSPYTVLVKAPSILNKIRVSGEGLRSGILDHYQGMFYIELNGIDPGQLKVRVHGPKNGYQLELYQHPIKHNIVCVNYHPTKPGVYDISVLWMDRHICFSPYEVYIARSMGDLKNWKTNKKKNDTSILNVD